jgi:uncharacterized membrane protein
VSAWRGLRDLLSWACLLGQVAYAAFHYGTLPAYIPTHFNSDGMANHFEPKVSLWAVVGISALAFVLLTVVENFPGWFNLPHPVDHPDRPRIEALGVDLVAWIRLEVTAMFTYIVWAIVIVAEGHRAGMGRWFITVPVTVVMITVGVFLWLMKPPRETA